MKKIIWIISLACILTACGTSNESSFKENSSEIISSGTTNNSEDHFSSSEESSLSSEDNSYREERNYKYHPLSEPDVNKQLVTFNPLGNLSEVWNYYRGDNVLVAVIDSEFDYDHPDFINEDGISKVSEKSAYIYTSNNEVKVEVGRSKVDITSYDSHGTMCAGLLGASVNQYGITGIAPNVDLMLIKIDKKATSMAEAFKYAADNGAKVISTSLGAYPSSTGQNSGDIIFSAGYDLSTAFNANINYAYSKGVTIVAATGNDRSTTLTYPAGCDNVIGAGGLNAGSQTKIWDNGYEGSNYNGSTTYVDVFAPSEGIYAPGYDTHTSSPTYWSDAKGTSFAAPLVAGAIALYYQKYPKATNKDVEKALQNACVDISSYNSNKNMGWGRLDVTKFLNIDEDIEKEEIIPSTSINQKATKLTIVDEAGWLFRTLHLFNLTFEEGYGYYEFERYLEHTYGKKVSTSSYQLEGTTRCYAYTDEGYIGDYYLCNGNVSTGPNVSYEYIFPWWVKGAYYQIVNNSNWIPEGGENFSLTNGYGKEINSYFWHKSDSDSGFIQVVETKEASSSFEAVKVNHNSNIIPHSIFDYFEEEGYYLDLNCEIPLERMLLNKDIIVY